ncbi:hypothetical protein B296_00038901 [Ensete ventricosum]|uniref:Uncharacterized protein n=1 Tax=Ensete ventricosum TaxID=4639 RepID=A0A426XYK0_ENSVE|nr:hypothetical protein B296_00038901 [Ensete ventricosum]
MHPPMHFLIRDHATTPCYSLGPLSFVEILPLGTLPQYVGSLHMILPLGTRTYPSWIFVLLEQLSSLHSFHWKFRRLPSPLDYSVLLNNLCLVLPLQMHLLDCDPSPIQSPLHPSSPARSPTFVWRVFLRVLVLL